jgi:hypothetical protein
VPLPQRAVNHIHPLALEYCNWVWENVFATVKHPFYPRKATGWMERVFKSRERQEKPRRSGKTLKQTLIEEFSWCSDNDVFLLYATTHGYMTDLGTFLEFQERFVTYFETGILCHPKDVNVVVFWEGNGPYFGRRRDRKLKN